MAKLIGVITAPELGSGSWPAWMRLVPKLLKVELAIVDGKDLFDFNATTATKKKNTEKPKNTVKVQLVSNS